MNAELRSLRDDPFGQLVELEARLRAARLDSTAGQAQVWTGLGFRVAEQWMVAPREDVREVAVPPRLTRVPNARPWLLGIANVRGGLLPVIDLQQLLGGAVTAETRTSRVLVFNSERMPLGYLVDEVAGYRPFSVNEQRRELIDSANDETRPWLLGGFVREGQPWLAFSLHKLAQSDVLKQAGW
jgi:twitching motility protein PilI